jgi:hypothetical protein
MAMMTRKNLPIGIAGAGLMFRGAMRFAFVTRLRP